MTYFLKSTITKYKSILNDKICYKNKTAVLIGSIRTRTTQLGLTYQRLNYII